MAVVASAVVVVPMTNGIGFAVPVAARGSALIDWWPTAAAAVAGRTFL